jgi:uncharacterized protein (AIM24 family)
VTHDAQIRQFVERAAFEHREQGGGVDGAASKSHTQTTVFHEPFVHRGIGDRMSAPGKAGAILPVEVRPK